MYFGVKHDRSLSIYEFLILFFAMFEGFFTFPPQHVETCAISNTSSAPPSAHSAEFASDILDMG